MNGQVYSRLKLLASSGTVNIHTNGKAQVTILDGEHLENVHMPTPYGFSHHPRPGSQAKMMFPGGDRSAGIAVIVADSRYKFGLEEGEVALHDDRGNSVHIKADGSIVATGTVKITAAAPLIELTGQLKIIGNVRVEGNITASGTIIGNT